MIETWHWLAFAGFVFAMLLLDLGIVHRHARETTMREAGMWTGVWALLALIFNGIVWWWLGATPAFEFFNGYLVEWMLSMDNVFVFAVIFGFFQVPMKYQHRVLFWGILGAVIMRLSFIIIGAELIERFKWILPLLGLVLVYTGVKLAFQGENEVDPDQNPILRFGRKYLPVAKEQHGSQFFAREAGRLVVTPLFLVLLVVESTDVVFAVDSVPTIFGLVNPTADYFIFIVFTSNVFAILGLRALYFLLAGMMGMFKYLSLGLSAILVFVGVKMTAQFVAEHYGWIAPGQHLVPSWVSLLAIVVCLSLSIGASLYSARSTSHDAHGT